MTAIENIEKLPGRGIVEDVADLSKEMNSVTAQSKNSGNTQEDVISSNLTSSANPDALKDALHVKEIYVTEGELLAWKGRWWRVHLNDETKKVEIVMVKPTAKAEKLAERSQRWLKRHPNSQLRLKGFRSPLEMLAGKSQSTRSTKCLSDSPGA